MSSSSNTTNSEYPGGDEMCFCRQRPVLRTSLTVANPGRRFLGCKNYKKNNACDYFMWVDKETCRQGLEYAKIMQAKKDELDRQAKELKMMNELLETRKTMVEAENEALLCKLADLTEMNVHLNEALHAKTAARQTRNKFGSVICVVVAMVVSVFVICVLLSSVKHSPKNRPLYLP
ncbi:hypothetical protein Vadar_014555 [Vaccinium darrowii]|uniref:Uncharacterized protein n=1 Tax=Vaccinium darrowii TaxID=229202 RepID=A0ACB7ZBN0_9ERIC|nr:hypothetical protein Vadar_014555 [Vaccinium darrowii]